MRPPGQGPEQKRPVTIQPELEPGLRPLRMRPPGQEPEQRPPVMIPPGQEAGQRPPLMGPPGPQQGPPKMADNGGQYEE